MRTKVKIIITSIAIICMSALGVFNDTDIPSAVASAQDFYIQDFTADYYLTKASDGSSNLHVKETLTAVFPETNQNHGITRIIPYTNQNGTNRTIRNQDSMNLSVLRNGQPENISRIEYGEGAFTAYIGDPNTYVHGEQIYELEYDFTNVITKFDENGKNISKSEALGAFQELYWDTNGNGWQQNFNRVTANLHYDSEISQSVIPDKTSCYVGKYGATGSQRCIISPISDGFSFTAEHLTSGENLTFAVDFQPGTFAFNFSTSYLLVGIFIVVVILASLIIFWRFRVWQKNAEPQYKLYKSLFTAPQYLPPTDKSIHVAEGAHLYLKKTHSPYVATVLELAVSKAITIIKESDPKKPSKLTWKIHLNTDPSTLTAPQLNVLRILANQNTLNQGDEIIVEKHTPSRTLEGYAKSFDKQSKLDLQQSKYIKDHKKQQGGSSWLVVLGAFILICFFVGLIDDSTEVFEFISLAFGNVIFVGSEILPLLMIIVVIITTIICIVLSSKTSRFRNYTDAGIKQAKYLEGLELYIKMAESDRLAFLQSVKGADTSNQGLVKLYEKLLPWACLFGLEKSWLEELSKYYEIEDVSGTFDTDLIHDVRFFYLLGKMDKVMNSSTAYYSSNGGGSSSSSSGGGGGGFSGGGGGGGGGGGW